ncbi:MAG: 3'-5' exonuclease [Anaerolineae bacterium]|nr:3'-5' exonuclease [Anaerolineae bacterium]
MAAHRNPRDRVRVQEWARMLFAGNNFYIIDTETTGLGQRDEVVQIGVIDKNGEVVMDTLVKPTQRVPMGAIDVHGISNEMLMDAPTFADVYTTLSIKLAGAPLIAYNMDFDWRLLQQTVNLYKLPMLRTGSRHCAMKQYATFRGSWNAQRRSYKWHSLSSAATYEKIQVVDAHSALGDVRMTLELLKCMAREDGE